MTAHKLRKSLSWIATAAFCGGLCTGAAAQESAEVEFLGNEVTVYADVVTDFEAMNVRIADPDGDLVLSAQSQGEPVAWSPAADDPEGLYRYEVVVIMADPEAETGQRLNRQSGSFELRGGVIVEP